jgi:hypothetical protein
MTIPSCGFVQVRAGLPTLLHKRALQPEVRRTRHSTQQLVTRTSMNTWLKDCLTAASTIVCSVLSPTLCSRPLHWQLTPGA